MSPIIWIPLTALLVALHSSLQHEFIHGHPTRSPRLNAALGFPALGMLIPYERFRALHLTHHRTADLTDPLADPESAYLSPVEWRRCPASWRRVLTLNNTLIGRCILGPSILLGRFYRDELKRIRAGEQGIALAWMKHGCALSLPILWLTRVCDIHPALYVAGSGYLGLSVLMIRTFAEHQASADPGRRTVVIEDRSPLSMLFLNNNLHAVHHAFPGAAWYRLPELLQRYRPQFLGQADAYHFRGYRELLGRYALRPKEPVAYPDVSRDPL
jgi:fatty acid desaturase